MASSTSGSQRRRIELEQDLYHGESWEIEEVRNALKAGKTPNIKVGVISVKCPDAEARCPSEIEGAKVGLCELIYRGRPFSD